MNCVNCYQEIPDGSKFCPYCGAQQALYAAPENADVQPGNINNQQENANVPLENTNITPENFEPAAQQPAYQESTYQQENRPGKTVNWVPYLVLSIISTVCCIPFGIVAIVYAVKINSLITEGKAAEARSAAKTAKIWIIVAFVTGIVFDILVFVFLFVSGAMNRYYGGIFDAIRAITYYL